MWNGHSEFDLNDLEFAKVKNLQHLTYSLISLASFDVDVDVDVDVAEKSGK